MARAGATATVHQLRADLGRKSVVGFYYFGHGYYSLHEDQACLVLADGRLYASEIEQLNPTIPFAFVDACLGAATGRETVARKEPATFALRPEAADGVVGPVLDRAAALAEGGRVTVGGLFRAFCQIANPGFQAFLTRLRRPWRIVKAFADGDPRPATPPWSRSPRTSRTRPGRSWSGRQRWT